jgi:hypothetical protein
MEITGYALRDALKQWELKLAASTKAFSASLHRFKDEADKKTPQEVVDDMLTAERAIVALQVVQQKYNLSVAVNVQGEAMTLAEAIKHVGAAGKIEKMWKNVAVGKAESRYSSYEDPTIRNNDPNQERAVPVMKSDEVLALTTQASRRASAFRSAIATANACVQDIPNLDLKLFSE